MKRSSLRRNAFAVGNEKERSDSTSNLDDVFHIDSTAESGKDEESRPNPQLTQEQITGKITKRFSALYIKKQTNKQ